MPPSGDRSGGGGAPPSMRRACAQSMRRARAQGMRPEHAPSMRPEHAPSMRRASAEHAPSMRRACAEHAPSMRRARAEHAPSTRRACAGISQHIPARPSILRAHHSRRAPFLIVNAPELPIRRARPPPAPTVGKFQAPPLVGLRPEGRAAGPAGLLPCGIHPGHLFRPS